MANVNTNGYTVGFAIGMAVIVATLLASVSVGLQPMQDVNKALEKKKNLISAVGVDIEAEGFDVDAYFEEKFDGFVVNIEGENIGDKASAFEVDLEKQVKIADKSARSFPVFVYKGESGDQYVLQARGAGLWDAIWVYLAVDADLNTVKGVRFGHKGETPGLGAEIKDSPSFYEQYTGKTLFEGDEFVGVSIVKGAAPEGAMHKVDGISGATMTCNGVNDMITDGIGDYLGFINKTRK